MFEAGALTMAAEQNGGKFMPYLFYRHASNREATIDDLQYAQYQKYYKENQHQLFILLQNLNASLSKSNQVDELQINSKINAHWNSISKRFDAIAYNLIKPGASSAGANSLDSERFDVFGSVQFENRTIKSKERCFFRHKNY